jgi:hypothetical protein
LTPLSPILRNCLRDGEERISGRNKLERLESDEGCVLMGKEEMAWFLDNPKEIPLSWKEKVSGKNQRFFFHGYVVEDSIGHQRVHFIWWSGSRWQSGLESLDADQDATTPSVVRMIDQ